MGDVPAVSNTKYKKNLNIDFRILCVFLLFIILVIIFFWRPWLKNFNANSRTVQVTGQATVKSTPDEFVFYPSYTSKSTDNQTAITELSKKSDELISKLKTFGISADNIKTNASSANGKYMVTNMYPMPEPKASSTLQLTIIATSKEQAQKVQDYLLTTDASGVASPSAVFSEAKLKDMQTKATDEATKDARKKAEQLAANLGFKLGAVKTIEDQAIGGIMPLQAKSSQAVEESGASSVSLDTIGNSGLVIMPGQDELNYNINVTYFIK